LKHRLAKTLALIDVLRLLHITSINFLRKLTLLFILIFTVQIISFSQKKAYDKVEFYIKPKKKIDSTFYKTKIQELDSLFGKNKILPKDYRLQSLIALSFFPKLKEIPIEFKLKRISTTMQCRPSFKRLAGKQPHNYKLYINKKNNFKGVLINEVPFNAQIGLIGHELAHIIDFESTEKNHLISRAMDYCTKKRKKNFEHCIDSLTIVHGLGWQLYDWAFFSLNNLKSSKKYKNFKSEIYMLPKLILLQIKTNAIYKLD